MPRDPVIDRIARLLPFESESDNLRAWIRIQFRVMALMTLLLVLAVVGWMSAQKRLLIDIPPDLRYGATVRPGEHSPQNVFSTAAYLWQYLNRWDDGEKDYSARIFELRAFLTPQCHAWLERDQAERLRKGELQGRRRIASPPPGWHYQDDLVEVLGHGVWRIHLDMQIVENVGRTEVKNLVVRYPLRVVAYDIDRDANPWAIAIDCLDGDAREIRPGGDSGGDS